MSRRALHRLHLFLGVGKLPPHIGLDAVFRVLFLRSLEDALKAGTLITVFCSSVSKSCQAAEKQITAKKDLCDPR